MDISAERVKQLRQQTGVGIMDCKKALQDADGDLDEAIQLLRRMGVAKAAKRAGREVNEGRIETYVHLDGRIAVLLELNCETDFVSRSDDFITLARDLAMHVAASNPNFVSRDDVDEKTIEVEREVYRAQAADQGKPADIVERIVDGKLKRFYSEFCLLEQPFVRDPDQSVAEIIAAAVARIGENIRVHRFARFALAETHATVALTRSLPDGDSKES